jgi:hypothetical protein
MAGIGVFAAKQRSAEKIQTDAIATMAARGQEGREQPHPNAGATSANIPLVIVMMVMVVVMMMIVVMMMVVMIMMMVVVVVMMVVFCNDHRLLFGNGGAFVLGSQNVRCIRNGIQQLGE